MKTKKETFKLKKSISIKGEKYTIKEVKNLKDDDGEDAMGLHDHVNKVISICKGMKEEEMRQTLLHELFHAYLYECSVREGLDSQMEEVIVELLSQCIDKHFHIKWKE